MQKQKSTAIWMYTGAVNGCPLQEDGAILGVILKQILSEAPVESVFLRQFTAMRKQMKGNESNDR